MKKKVVVPILVDSNSCAKFVPFIEKEKKERKRKKERKKKRKKERKKE